MFKLAVLSHRKIILSIEVPVKDIYAYPLKTCGNESRSLACKLSAFKIIIDSKEPPS